MARILARCALQSVAATAARVAVTRMPQTVRAVQLAPSVIARNFSVQVPVPSMGDSIPEGEVKKVMKAVGDFVAQDEVVVLIETDKVTVEVRSPVAGQIESLAVSDGQTVKVGANLMSVNDKAAGAPAAKAAAPKAEAPKAEAPKAEAPKAAAAPAPAAPAAPAPAAAPAAPKAAAPAAGGEKPAKAAAPVSPIPTSAKGARTEDRVAMSRMRQRISERLKESQNTAAMLTTFQECDMSQIMEMRTQYKDKILEKYGVKLGFMGAFMKASASALQEIPAVNAVIDGKEIVYRNYVDISVAVASPRGLVVPVVRDVQSMGILEIEKSLETLAIRARNDQITMEEMAGGTFTVSNGGVFGSLMGTPILNLPQSAILGMHAVKERAVVVKGEIKIRPVMYLALTYDHRLIDGREAVTFLCSVRDKIEDPRRLLLGL